MFVTALATRVALGLLPLLALQPMEINGAETSRVSPLLLADVIINVPVIIQGEPSRPEQRVVVELVAPGQEWAEVSLNGQRVFSPRTFERRRTLRLRPGAYRLEITGFNRFEEWATGYLDVGRDDSNVLVVTFSRDAVQVSDPAAWIPD